jgi:aminopeptidase N
VDVTVRYHGVPEPIVLATDFFELGWHTEGRSAYVVSEPAGAQTWFPSNDHPTDKATFSIAVTAPSDLEVLSNGELAGREDAGGRTTWTYVGDDAMATYLASVVIGDYVIETSTTPSGLALRNVFPASETDRSREVFAAVPEMLAFYTEQFGPYPFDSYGHILVADVEGFALENQTLSLFGGDALSEPIAAHELVHQWFGNAVSLGRWGDIWLNEGFATYGEWLWEEHRGADLREIAEFMHEQAAAIDVPPATPPADELFHGTVYLRGGLVLYALRLEIGVDRMADLLRRWYATHRGGSATTEDFVALAEEVAGRDLDAFFDGWLFGTELPPLPG